LRRGSLRLLRRSLRRLICARSICGRLRTELAQQKLRAKDDGCHHQNHEQKSLLITGLGLWALVFGHGSVGGAFMDLRKRTSTPDEGVRGYRIRNRVISTLHKWMAAQQAPYCHRRSAQRAVAVNSFGGIFGAGWNVAARRQEHRRDGPFVSAEQAKQHGLRNSKKNSVRPAA